MKALHSGGSVREGIINKVHEETIIIKANKNKIKIQESQIHIPAQ